MGNILKKWNLRNVDQFDGDRQPCFVYMNFIAKISVNVIKGNDVIRLVLFTLFNYFYFKCFWYDSLVD